MMSCDARSLQEERAPAVLVRGLRSSLSERHQLRGGPDPTSRSGRHQQELRQAEQAGRRRHDAPAAANQLHP